MNTLIYPFVAASAKGAAWLLVWSWQAAVLLACVWAGLKIFRVKSPALRHQVWLFALIAVAAMPILSGVVQNLPLPKPNNRALNYAVELPRIVVTNDAAPMVQNPPPDVSVKPSTKQPIILSLSLALWLAGVIIFVMKATINGVRLRRLRAGARRASLSDLDCEECDCEALRAGKVSLALSDEIHSPILLGVLRPMIVFPTDIAAWTSPVERRAMLRHELAHVEQRDHYVNLFQTIIGAVFFFHPLVRYACRQLSVEREMACDDHVVGSGAEAEAYAESIIKAAERSIGTPGGVHQLALFSTRQILERRIEMILNKDRARLTARKRRHLILPAMLIAIVAWALLPARLTKPGLAQQAATSDFSSLGLRGEIERLAMIAQTEQSPELRPPPSAERMAVAAGQEPKPVAGNELKPIVEDGRESTLDDLLRKMAEANLRRDISVFEWFPDYSHIGTSPDGDIFKHLAEVKYSVKSLDFDHISVSVNPDLAIATFLGTVYLQSNGQDSTAQFHYTVAFTKREGEWKVLTTHMSRKQPQAIASGAIQR